MRKIYLDTDFKCYLTDAEDRTAIETGVFDNLAPEVVEGYRYVPAGQSWTREDGTVFNEEMVAPWKNSYELEEIQRNYEHEKYIEAISVIDELLIKIEETKN